MVVYSWMKAKVSSVREITQSSKSSCTNSQRKLPSVYIRIHRYTKCETTCVHKHTRLHTCIAIRTRLYYTTPIKGVNRKKTKGKRKDEMSDYLAKLPRACISYMPSRHGLECTLLYYCSGGQSLCGWAAIKGASAARDGIIAN